MSCPRPELTSCGMAASGTVSSEAMASALIFLSHSRRKCLEPSVLFLLANTICTPQRLTYNALTWMLITASIYVAIPGMDICELPQLIPTQAGRRYGEQSYGSISAPAAGSLL